MFAVVLRRVCCALTFSPFFFTSPSLAALITAPNVNGSTINFDIYDDDLVTPIDMGIDVGETVFLTSSLPKGIIVSTSVSAAFGSNGLWSLGTRGPGAFVATGSIIGPERDLQFAFDNPVNSVGGFINYCTGFCAGSTFLLLALDQHGAILESHELLVSAPIGFGGEFRGIERAQNDIYAFRLFSDTFFAVDDLNFTRVVPIPPALALLVSSLAVLVGVGRRQLRTTS